VNEPARFLFFLQTTAFNTSGVGHQLWTYRIYISDGSIREIPVLSLVDVGDWQLWSQAGWQYTLAGSRVYIQVFQNPERKFIEGIEMISTSNEEVPVLLAITAGM
jgi:hypothetical protein